MEKYINGQIFFWIFCTLLNLLRNSMICRAQLLYVIISYMSEYTPHNAFWLRLRRFILALLRYA